MAFRLFRRHGVRTAQQQAALFHARERRRGLYEPSLDLHRTHRLSNAQGAIDVGDMFPSRLEPITLAFTVVRTGASNGVLFEFGSAARGFAAALDVGDLIVAAGEGIASSDGVTLTLAGALPEEGVKYRVAIAIVPGLGSARAWVNGALVGSDVSASGSFGGDWAADEAGRIADVSGTIIDRIPVGQRVALADASIVGDAVLGFDHQHPRHDR